MDDAIAPRRAAARELGFVAAYLVVYVGYLFLYQEPELVHWLSLVLLPLLGLFLIGRYASLRALLDSVGISAGRARRGWVWVVVLGIGFQILQLMNQSQRTEFEHILREPLGYLAPLGAIVLLASTSATTEEFFFRGILQSRLSNRLGNEPAALTLATLAFALYHLPYAFLTPSWPSAGDFPRAVELALGTGVPTGIALGAVYWRSGRNLIATIALHALIDLIPATRLVHRLF